MNGITLSPAITTKLSSGRVHGEGEPRLVTVIARRLLHDGWRQLKHVAVALVHALTPTEADLGQCHAGLPRLRPTRAITRVNHQTFVGR